MCRFVPFATANLSVNACMGTLNFATMCVYLVGMDANTKYVHIMHAHDVICMFLAVIVLSIMFGCSACKRATLTTLLLIHQRPRVHTCNFSFKCTQLPTSVTIASFAFGM